MKIVLKILLTVSAFALCTVSRAQIINPGDKVPAGAIVYSLPVTNLQIVAQATFENFTAGPYARFAQKYLGVTAREDNNTTYRLSSVEITPFIEADQSVNIALNLGNNRNASANFLEMTNLGLIMWSDTYAGKSQKIKYPNLNSTHLFTKAASTSNLTNERSTLYRTVQTATGTERVAVQQSQVVEKSLEKRAEETAAAIFRLRAKRLEIITGETDATFSGDALRAAIEEINRLEDEYLALFMGKVATGSQIVTFDLLPKSSNDKQIYIAFRLSETQGLLPAGNLSGRPIVLELINEDPQAPVSMDVAPARGRVIYRKPAMMNAKLMDGQTLILQSRIPMYQFGQTLSFPIEIATGRL